VLLCLATTLAIALLLRTHHISDISLSFDECCSWKISQFPWDEMLDAVSRDAHPPVYYVLMKWLGIFVGDSPEVIRGFSVVFGLATVLAAFWFVRTAMADRADDAGESDAAVRLDARGTWPNGTNAVDSNLAAVLAAVLVAGSVLHVDMSLQARPYTLGTFLALVSGTCLLRAVRHEGAVIDWLGFAVAATLFSLTHYYGLFTVAAELLFALGVLAAQFWRGGWCPPTKRLLVGLGLSAWGMQLLWSAWWPVFEVQRERSTSQLWMSPLDWNALCANCWQALGEGQGTAVPERMAWLAVAVWGTVVVVLFAVGARSGRLAALCAGIPLVAIVAYALTVRNILGAKYLIFAQVFLLVSLVLLLARIPWRPVRFIVAAGLVAWNGFWCWRYAESRETIASFPGVRGAVAWLDGQRHPDEPVIVGSPFVSIIVQKYIAHSDGVYVLYGGDHRRDMLGGPPLREEEYRDLESHLPDSLERAWTVDVFELGGHRNSRMEVELPGAWNLVGEKVFREAYGHSSILVLREYRRQMK
jgi:hypothetical protein